MARFVNHAAGSVFGGIRKLQAAQFRAQLERLPVSTTGVYDFRGHRTLLLQRISELEAGEAVHLQRHELADELVQIAGLRSRWDSSGPKCFRIEGDGLFPEDYERK